MKKTTYPGGGSAGAAEHLDIKGAGEWLARQPQANPARVNAAIAEFLERKLGR